MLGKLTAGAGNDVLSIWVDPADLKNPGAASFVVDDRDLIDSLTGLGLLSWNSTGEPFNTSGGYIDALRLSNAPDGYRQVTGVVPEPASLSLLGTGLMLLARRRRVA